MKTISESDMQFGCFQEDNLFHIEKSKLYQKLGDGVKTVEFLLESNNDILFVEAKRSCPNSTNKNKTVEKAEKFEEYYTSITDKFVDSLQIYAASILGRYDDITEIGSNLIKPDGLKNVRLVFILVIKHADDITWLAGPMAELRRRLLRFRKIWGVEVLVLSESMARDKNILI